MNKISVRERIICLCFVSIVHPSQLTIKVAKYCNEHVCVSVSLVRVSKRMSRRHKILRMLPVVVDLSSFEYFLFQFCGRRVFTQWSGTCDMVHAHGQSDSPGSSSGAAAVLRGRGMTPVRSLALK